MLSNASPKVPPGKLSLAEERALKKTDEARRWRKVCLLVDRRDGRHCRVCERPCGGLSMLTRPERHHLIPRSRGGPDEMWNLATLCRLCHDARHVTGLLQLSGNADERNELGKLAGIKVERLTEAGWRTERWV